MGVHLCRGAVPLRRKTPRYWSGPWQYIMQDYMEITFQTSLNNFLQRKGRNVSSVFFSLFRSRDTRLVNLCFRSVFSCSNLLETNKRKTLKHKVCFHNFFQILDSIKRQFYEQIGTYGVRIHETSDIRTHLKFVMYSVR